MVRKITFQVDGPPRGVLHGARTRQPPCLWPSSATVSVVWRRHALRRRRRHLRRAKQGIVMFQTAALAAVRGRTVAAATNVMTFALPRLPGIVRISIRRLCLRATFGASWPCRQGIRSGSHGLHIAAAHGNLTRPSTLLPDLRLGERDSVAPSTVWRLPTCRPAVASLRAGSRSLRWGQEEEAAEVAAFFSERATDGLLVARSMVESGGPNAG
jgi:hypothetical protein